MKTAQGGLSLRQLFLAGNALRGITLKTVARSVLNLIPKIKSKGAFPRKKKKIPSTFALSVGKTTS